MCLHTNWQNPYKQPKIYAPFRYAFNVMNTKQLLLEIQEIPFDEELNFASFDITKVYTNVPDIQEG
jgi:hypothetical protein